MKKFLLLGAVILTFGACAMAQEERDITPKAYIFDNELPVPYYDTTYGDGSGAWNAAPFKTSMYLQNGAWNNGLVLVRPCGGMTTANFEAIEQAAVVKNFGGTLGNCWVYDQSGNLNDVIKDFTGFDMEIPTCGYRAYTQFYWVLDPREYTLAEDEHIRVRIVMNAYTSDPNYGTEVMNTYVNSNENNVMPIGDDSAEGVSVNAGEFVMYYGENEETGLKNDDASEDDMGKGNEIVNDEEQFIWNPASFLVYEFDTTAGNGGLLGEDDKYAGAYPAKLKLQLPGAGAGLIFKEISFLAVKGEPEYKVRTRSNRYYTMDPENAVSGINNIAAPAQGLFVDVDGNSVSTSVAARIYTANGQQVAAGQNANLAKGLYIATANGQSVKFVVR